MLKTRINIFTTTHHHIVQSCYLYQIFNIAQEDYFSWNRINKADLGLYRYTVFLFAKNKEAFMMRKMDYQNVRGTQDYLPEQEAVRRKVRRTLEDTFILYGCKPLETPILNYTELMASKNEVEMNCYKLKDMDSGEEQLVNFVFKQ